MNKCIFCDREGTRFKVVDKTTYWLCGIHHADMSYGEIVAYHNKQKLVKKKSKVEMIAH